MPDMTTDIVAQVLKDAPNITLHYDSLFDGECVDDESVTALAQYLIREVARLFAERMEQEAALRLVESHCGETEDGYWIEQQTFGEIKKEFGL